MNCEDGIGPRGYRPSGQAACSRAPSATSSCCFPRAIFRSPNSFSACVLPESPGTPARIRQSASASAMFSRRVSSRLQSHHLIHADLPPESAHVIVNQRSSDCTHRGVEVSFVASEDN